MTADQEFAPDWLSPPGDTIKDALAYHRLSSEVLGEALGLSSLVTVHLLTGEVPIDAGLATGLATTLGGTESFWLKREGLYRDRLNQAPPTENFLEFSEFKAALPLKDMRNFGWLQNLANGGEGDEAIKAFFEDTPGAWMQSGPSLAAQVRFRTSSAHATNPAAVAAWLRQGVRAARRVTCAPWKPERLRAALPDIRALVRIKKPATFFPRLVEIGRASGVAIVFVRTPNGCRASGATHFESPDKAVLQLSFRYRSDDHFWFTVFHEIGHLLLHPTSPLFLEGQDYEVTEEESEANRFAADVLIPAEFEGDIESIPLDFRVYARLAKRIGISTGVLVGQMQNRGFLKHNQMNSLKERYNWADVEEVTL